MHKKFMALGVGLGLLAVLAILPAKGAISTVVIEDFENGVPGEVPSGWVSLGGTTNFYPGISDTRANLYGNYSSGQTMALTNPELESEGMVGVIFYENPVDLRTNKLMIKFDLLISPGTTTTPADGCCIMILPKIPAAPGAGGGGMGWSGLGGFAVEFDIYDNGDVDPDDLVGQTAYQAAIGEAVEGNTLANPAARQVGVDVARVGVNGDIVSSIITTDLAENLAVYPNVPDFLAPFDLGSTVIVTVWIEYNNGHIKVEMESADEAGIYPEFAFARKTVLEGPISPWSFHNEDCPEEAYVGFAGSTGGSNALQEVDNLVIQLDTAIGAPEYNEDIPAYPAPPEVDPASKVAEVGAATELGWNVSTVKLNEESGQTFASFNNDLRVYKTHWVLDNTPPTASETTLLVNYASGVNAANAGMFPGEVNYPGIPFMPQDPPAEEQIDNFAVRATGFIEFPVPGVYFLGTCHDDNFTTFIGGKRLAQATGTGNPTRYKINVPEAGIYPIQIDLAEQGYYSYFSVFQSDGCGGASILINDGSQVKVYTDVDGGVIPPTNWDALNIVTADPAEKVGEVGEGTNPGFAYKYRVMTQAAPIGVVDLNSYVDAAMVLSPGVPDEIFTILDDGVVPVVNFNVDTNQAGNQPGDMALPVGNGDDSAMLLTGFAEFPTAGMYAMFFSSDDGFEAGIGTQRIMTAGNKGASDVPVFVNIEEPGLYPLKLTWYDRAGGKNLEFVQWTDTGATLVNSESATVKVYQNAPGEADAAFLPNAYQVAMATGTCLDSGFNVRFVKHPGGVGNLTQCEELLAGLRPTTYTDISVQPLIDFWSTSGEGNFVTGVPFPTLQPNVDDNDFAMEVTGFIELTAGWHMFGFNSDDGFDLTIGGRRVCFFQDGKGTSNVNGGLFIPETGIYPLRVSYWEGGGGAAAELYYLNLDETVVRVNDTASGGPAVCVALDGGVVEAPIITSLTLDGGNVIVTWEGGTPPYQVQVTGELGTEWTNAGEPTTETSVAIPTTAAVGFLRVVAAGN